MRFAAYQRARDALVEELGVDPGPELRHLEAAILAQDPSLLVAAPGASGPVRSLPVALDPGGTLLVGRAGELARLRDAWARAFAGIGEFLAVVGREGVGKTRLVAELAVEAAEAGAIVLYARCDAADRAPEAPIDRALRGGGARFADIAVEPGETKGQALARFLPTWCAGRPVLLVLDDVHVADTGTVEALADLAEWSGSAPLLVIATFDPLDGDGGDSGRGRVVLPPLGLPGVREIAQAYRSDWDEAEVAELFTASGGIPLAAHRLASEWAQEATRRQVHAATERTAEAQVRLVATRGDLVDGIDGLQRLLEQRQVQLAPSADPGQLGRVPYRGLEAFGADDADLFFGREQLASELVARVATTGLVAVVAASGSGKSSLVRAGMLPALQSGVVWDVGTWVSATITPGDHPRLVLAAALGGLGEVERRVLVVDQFEELWTSCDDAEERAAFCDELVALAGDERTSLVLCIRADFVERAAENAPLAALVGASTVLLPPMTDEELRRVVEGPARRTGLTVEPQLVEAVVADVRGRPGALPLLSTALLATWERRDARTLTLDAYRAAGGVVSAIASMADGCYLALSAGARRAARRLLVQLAGKRAVSTCAAACRSSRSVPTTPTPAPRSMPSWRGGS